MIAHLRTTIKKRYDRYQSLKPIHFLNIMNFFQQLAMLSQASIALLPACELILETQTKLAMRHMILSIRDELIRGKSLSFSMQKYTKLIDPFIIQLIRLSEETGQLDQALVNASDFLENQWRMKNKIKQILFYPFLILTIAFLVLLFMLIFIVPHFEKLFQSFSVELPLFTRGIFALSHLLTQHGFALFFTLSLLFVTTYLFAPLKSGRFLKKYLYAIPIINRYWHQLSLMQFARQTAITFEAGLPILKSIELTASHLTHRSWQSSLFTLQLAIQSGSSLYQAMARLQIFPAFFLQMVKLGEESGRLAPLLYKTADLIESDLILLNQRLQALLEPLIMLILGVLIGGMVIGMYLPIFRLGSAF